MILTPFQALSLSLVLLAPIVYKIISQALSKHLRATLTALDDLPLLTNVRSDENMIQGTAVVCGGSVAGLVTARVCSNHFKKVIIIEPEDWVTAKDGLQDHHRDNSATEHPPPKRSRVAQYTSLHIYHGFVTLMFQRLFPEMEREFARQGVRITPMEAKLTLSGVPMLPPYQRNPKGILAKVIWATRPIFETTLRRLVMTNCSNVTYHSGTVTGLVQSESSGNLLSAVRVKSRIGGEHNISASLVVDCTGPALGRWRWLKELFPAPDAPLSVVSHTSLSLESLKVTYDHKMAYTTCEFDVHSSLFASLKLLGFPMDYETAGNVYIYIPNSTVERNNFLMQRRENNILHIGCGGWDVNERITSIAGIRSFLSEMVPSQPIPKWIFAMLDLFEKEGVSVSYVFARCPPAVYVPYHRARTLPCNFVAIGDSVMQSNPIAGQGCTKACVEAVTLNALLARYNSDSSHGTNDLPADFSQRFFAAQANRTGYVWESMKTTDYSFKTTIPVPGENLETNAWKRAYVGVVMRLSTKDLYVAGVIYQTNNWLAPYTDIFSPIIVGKVLWYKIRGIIGV